MTTGSTSNSNHHPLHPRDDRETLSALFDGELSTDAMRFALKRLDHDAGWRETCGRWQLIGDALRGEATAAVPAEFAVGVMRTLAAETQGAVATPASIQATRVDSSVRASSRRRWIGGAALAASVAMAAVLVVRPFSDTSSQVPAGQVASGVSSSTATQAAVAQPASDAPNSTAQASSKAASSNPTAVAIADEPRTTAAQRAARSTRAASRPVRDVIAPVSSPASDTATAVAAATPATTGRQQPFHPPAVDIVTRPWPRAVLPDNAAAGALTVDFGEGSSPSLYPFEPRLPSQDPSTARPQTPDPQR